MIIRKTRNGEDLQFIISAAIQPVRCDFQLVDGTQIRQGTISVSSCPPLFGDVSVRKMIANVGACKSTVIPSLDNAR